MSPEARTNAARRFLNWLLNIRGPVSRPSRLLLGTIPIVVLLLLWQALTSGAVEERVLSPLILPSPRDILGKVGALWFESELSRSALASIFRVMKGFAVALAVAFPLGLAMGAFSKVKALFDPLVVFAAYLPIPALVPLTLSLFGTDELQKVMFLALAFLAYLLPLFISAVEKVDNVFLQTAYTLGASRAQVVRHVLLGVAAPQIFQAMRLGFGVGWTYIILAEMVDARRGLGHIIIVAQRRGPFEFIYLVLVVIVILAYLTDRLWDMLGKKLFPYLEQR